MNTKKKDSISGMLVGFGLALGFIPILMASLIIKQNIFIVILEQMDVFWKKREND